LQNLRLRWQNQGPATERSLWHRSPDAVQ